MLMKESLPLYTDFEKCHSIDPCYYTTYDIKRGLRNADGTGVWLVLRISRTCMATLFPRAIKFPIAAACRIALQHFRFGRPCCCRKPFRLRGNGIPAYGGRASDGRAAENLQRPHRRPARPTRWIHGELHYEAPTRDLMNAMSRAVLQLYAFDDEAENRSSEHEIDTAIMLLSRLPRIMVLSYHVMRDKFFGDSMFIHHYIPGQSTAETILSMLRPDRQFTDTEAKTLDIMLMLHAEHGGGNNSTFTCRAVTSADTDPYSAYAAAIGSLKGARHGGANNRTLRMTDDIKQHVADITDEGQVADYLRKIVRKEAYDRTGLIYGMGHAVYTLSDPRAELLHKYAERLVVGTEHEAEFRLLEIIERLAPQLLAEAGKSKDICANVDLYSGCVYSTLGIPRELLTPMFASARMAGWSAHRFEEIVSGKRIMRPAFKKTGHAREYVDIADRK